MEQSLGDIMSWSNFLREMADRYGLSPEQTDVFLPRFGEKNRGQTESQITEGLPETLGVLIDPEAYKKRMKGVYDKFTRSRQNPEGCPDIDYKGPHKFKKLLAWLEDKYQTQSGNQHSQANFESGLEYPEGQVPLGSPFYIERPSIESICYRAILKPGALLRIKAPKQMGKTSLMARVMERAAKENCQTVYLDMAAIDLPALSNIDKFLRCFCLIVGRQLKLENQLDEYWDEELLSSSNNCTAYFEEYLFSEIKGDLVLGLDEVDRLFSYPALAEDFLAMLRSWHEKAKNQSVWKRSRLIVAHATEVYIDLDMNQSPFNVGVPIELLDFAPEQVEDLARRQGLEPSECPVEKLTAMVGGHPGLVRLALYEIAIQNATLEQILQDAPTEAGIYRHHLRRHLETLQKNPLLAEALKQVIDSPEPVKLDPIQIYKLHSMGLVERQHDRALPRCNLYREYFGNIL